MNFGDKLKTLREQRGITIPQMAKLLGGPSNANYWKYWSWENNRRKPTNDNLFLLADILEIPARQLLEMLKK